MSDRSATDLPTPIQSVIRGLFPNGTRPYIKDDTRSNKKWLLSPLFPTDVFAAAATLVDLSGAYHHVFPSETGIPSKGHCIVLEDHDRIVRLSDEWLRVAKEAKDNGRIAWDPPTQELWTKLWEDDGPIVPTRPIGKCPPWWTVALELLAVSDMASDRIGFSAGELNVFDDIISLEPRKSNKAILTQASALSSELACVQPKSRTPRVGCTIRSLTHNLALLPGRGIVEMRWHYLPSDTTKSDHDALNLVLIPFPYNISAKCFKKSTEKPSDEKQQWMWFEMDQRWLRKRPDVSKDAAEITKCQNEIADFIHMVVDKALDDIEHVHGVVLPELAMDWDTYDVVCDRIWSELLKVGKAESLEFVISGVSNQKIQTRAKSGKVATKKRKGNFVVTTRWIREATDGSYNKVHAIREKHHRWKLDGSQIRRYSLSSALDPKKDWWEKIDLLARNVDTVVFRRGSTITTLICEDLARIDPCQQVVRAIGPNLVIALLMDGAQTEARWPARYATILADDPGSSVLTLTSLALVERANWNFPRPSRSIALWKDDVGGLREITLPRGDHAVAITLSGNATKEHTLDGRSDNGATLSWRLEGQTPLRVDKLPARLGWIFDAR
jgi:hypothetical protein